MFKLLKTVLVIFLLTLCTACNSKKRNVSIGILLGSDSMSMVLEGFIQEMENLGFEEGVNTEYDIRHTNSDIPITREHCRQLIDNKVDLIISISHGVTVVAKEALAHSDIPLLFSVAMVERDDLINNLSNPGGNISGVRYPSPDLSAKRFELLMSIKPDTHNILIYYKEGYSPAIESLNQLRPLASAQNVTIIDIPVSSISEIEQDVKHRSSVDVVFTLPEPFAISDRGWKVIEDFSKEKKIPIAGLGALTFHRGSLYSYGIDHFEMGVLTAPMAEKVLNGVSPGSIPVKTPEVKLYINVKKAALYGLTIPEYVLDQAWEIKR